MKLKRTLLLLGMGLGLALTQVQAKDMNQPIFKTPASGFLPSPSKNFAINPELGRAWVEVDLFYPSSEMVENHRVAVPGLRYDRQSAEVVFETAQERVVCATVTERGWWIFSHHRVRPTGACELTHRYEQHPSDNGFTVEHVEHFEVHFKAADAAERG